MGYSPWDHKESDMTEGLHFMHMYEDTKPVSLVSCIGR